MTFGINSLDILHLGVYLISQQTLVVSEIRILMNVVMFVIMQNKHEILLLEVVILLKDHSYEYIVTF